MKKLWYDKAWEEYSGWQNLDRKTLRKINSLLESIDRNGYGCTGQPEQLKGDFVGWWSVHIDKANRLVFKIENEELVIYSCAGHCE